MASGTFASSSKVKRIVASPLERVVEASCASLRWPSSPEERSRTHLFDDEVEAGFILKDAGIAGETQNALTAVSDDVEGGDTKSGVVGAVCRLVDATPGPVGSLSSESL